MAHYAFIDANNIVVNVIVGKDENEGNIDWEQHYGEVTGLRCLRTSYNTFEGTHLNGKEPFRKNYACIGYSYDEERDAFIPPKVYASWLFDENKCSWVAPIPYPNDGLLYRWDEEQINWAQL